ncbi:MAG TPA: two-component regulator propeller domain-containing protein [Bryobacteraceae bacterium]|jgi:signal transduction histidine kinase/ligand-binding sensor domain-containing protein|nr:two-component regulator propeller domain-containing protein [Bryobacteraceae bacterium]
MTASWLRRLLGVWICCALAGPVLALDPLKGLTQYSRTVWTQGQGLPQDTIRAIAQTTDGYLWLGTDEGLARFDGYDFTVFDKGQGYLPSNSIGVLEAGPDGSLWIGSPSGLTHFRDKQFHTYTTKDGLPDDAIAGLFMDHAGTLWIVSGLDLAEFRDGKFHVLAAGKDLPFSGVRSVYEDRHHNLWVAGFGGVVKRQGDKFVTVVDAAILGGDIITRLAVDDHDNLWIAGSEGLIERSPDGQIRRYGTRGELADPFLRAMWLDRDGNIWAGTNAGLARLEKGHLTTISGPLGRFQDQVRCLFEDREGNLWVGASDGLTRLRDDVFTVYGTTEGLPNDPDTVFEDRQGRLWIGYHDSGLLQFSTGGSHLFTVRDGLPSNEIFSIRDTRGGDLLVGTRDGLARLHGGHFSTFRPMDPLRRESVYDSLEDSTGKLWLALPQGLSILEGNRLQTVIPSGTLLNTAFVALCEGRDFSIWAGTYGKGLWRLHGNEKRQFTTADGLSNDQIRAIYQERDGTLWIATFGGGLNAYRDGKFTAFTAKDGLLSDNIADLADDGESLWLSTTRGISRISKRQLRDFANHQLRVLEPINYGVGDGLRSAQCAPGFPLPGGGSRSSDGRLWFPTSRGLAVIDPNARRHAPQPPALQLVDVTADGRPLDVSHPAQLEPGSERVQIRYTAIYLSAPERVQYSRKLEGLDTGWVRAGNRRVSDYNSLPHGKYRFVVRAQLPGGPATEKAYDFEVLPSFYETTWFRLVAVALVLMAGWAIYQFRLRQIRYRFSLVLEERARLAREIHDTLAQGFVGISSQLDAVAMAMPESGGKARQFLELARKMARHSLTEARRSVMDLRASVLEGRDLAAALNSGAQMWAAGSGVEVEVDISGERRSLPEEMEQHLLRIAQEGVTNVLKHSGATKVWVKLHTEARKLYLRIADNGKGFEQQEAFSAVGGHFGLIGMRERAEQMGGELRLASHPGEGTELEITVPLR